MARKEEARYVCSACGHVACRCWALFPSAAPGEVSRENGSREAEPRFRAPPERGLGHFAQDAKAGACCCGTCRREERILRAWTKWTRFSAEDGCRRSDSSMPESLE
jgi:hypothetical protein